MLPYCRLHCPRKVPQQQTQGAGHNRYQKAAVARIPRSKIARLCTLRYIVVLDEVVLFTSARGEYVLVLEKDKEDAGESMLVIVVELEALLTLE
jgi:hypothetical protein